VRTYAALYEPDNVELAFRLLANQEAASAKGQERKFRAHRLNVGMLCRQEALQSLQRWNVAAMGGPVPKHSLKLSHNVTQMPRGFDVLPVSRLTGVGGGPNHEAAILLLTGVGVLMILQAQTPSAHTSGDRRSRRMNSA
jgi:hypothetical protein